MVTECPKISDTWKGGVMEVARILGVSDQTIRRLVAKGKSCGGLDFKVGKNGRKQFTGREVKRYWKSY